VQCNTTATEDIRFYCPQFLTIEWLLILVNPDDPTNPNLSILRLKGRESAKEKSVPTFWVIKSKIYRNAVHCGCSNSQLGMPVQAQYQTELAIRCCLSSHYNGIIVDIVKC